MFTVLWNTLSSPAIFTDGMLVIAAGLVTILAWIRAGQVTNERTLAVLEIVENNPGIFFVELQAHFPDLSRGSLRYHLEVLERHGLVLSKKQRSMNSYHSRRRTNLVPEVGTPTERVIFDLLEAEPRSWRIAELSAVLQLPKQTIHSNLVRLLDAELVVRGIAHGYCVPGAGLRAVRTTPRETPS